MTFDEIVFICQILSIKDKLTNQIKLKNYPNFIQPVSNSNISSTNNNIFLVREYITPQISRFITPVITAIAYFLAENENDFMDLSVFRKPKKLFTPEKRKYRFDNNFCFYCGTRTQAVFCIQCPKKSFKFRKKNATKIWLIFFQTQFFCNNNSSFIC